MTDGAVAVMVDGYICRAVPAGCAAAGSGGPQLCTAGRGYGRPLRVMPEDRRRLTCGDSLPCHRYTVKPEAQGAIWACRPLLRVRCGLPGGNDARGGAGSISNRAGALSAQRRESRGTARCALKRERTADRLGGRVDGALLGRSGARAPGAS